MNLSTGPRELETTGFDDVLHSCVLEDGVAGQVYLPYGSFEAGQVMICVAL